MGATGVAISVMILTLATGFFAWLGRSTESEAGRFSGAVVMQLPRSSFPPLGERWQENLAEEALALTLVDEDRSTPVIFQALQWGPSPEEDLIGVGLLPGREKTYTGVEPPLSLLSGQPGALLGREAADLLDVGPGETLVLAGHRWEVVGVLPPSGAYTVDRSFIVPLDMAQEAFQAPGLISWLILFPREDVTPRALEARLSGLFPGMEALGSVLLKARIREEQGQASDVLASVAILSFLTGVVMLTGSLMVSVVSRAVRLLGEEDRRLPRGRGEILGHTMALSVAQAFLGGIPGLLAGAILARLAHWPFLLTPFHLLLLAGVILLLGLSAGVYPTLQAGSILWRAARFGRLERDMQEAFESREDVLRIFRQQIQARERERQSLARELHDGVLQSLLGLKMGLRGPGPHPDLSRALDEAIRDLRRLCSDLRPPALDHLGLGPALRSMASELSRSSPVSVFFWEEGEDRSMPEESAIVLYRVAQEAVANALRHSGGSRIEIVLRHLPTRSVLEVSDNGRGFSPPSRPTALARRGHYGLAGMHERVSLAGGRLSISSQPGQGTRIRSEIPVPQDYQT